MWWEIEGHLEKRKNKLFIGGLDTNELAEKYGTPLFVYDLDRIEEKFEKVSNLFRRYSDKPYRIHYSAKANPHPAVLSRFEKLGAHLDTVSPGEVEIGLKSGFEPERILYTGTSVSNEDLKRVLDSSCRLNIDSISQLNRLNQIVDDKDYDRDEVKISIRGNPGQGGGIDSKTITAGAESHGKPIKFGLSEERVKEAAEMVINYGFDLIGLHQHIGSGWLGDEAIDNFLETVDSTLEMASGISETSGGLEFVDFGGGPGIPYTENDPEFDIEKYVKGICRKVSRHDSKFEEIAIEPGRYFVGDSGLLLTEVNTVEEKHGNLIVGVNSGFNHLLRPAFYDSQHEVINCSGIVGEKVEGSIAGNLCETGDILANQREIFRPEEGDLLAFHNVGAYGMCMSSNYNSRERPAEVAILNGTDCLITERETVEDLLTGKKIPF